MIKDDIMRMAREAGFYFHDAGYAPILHTTRNEYSEKCFEHFAALVAAAEREACAEHYLDICRKAIVEEREACYQIALTIGDDGAACKHTDEVARRIRARSNT